LADIDQVASGTNVLSGGYLRVTTSGLIQVDVDGGGDGWASLSSINGSGAVNLRYMANGALTTVSASRVAEVYAAQAQGLGGLVDSDGIVHSMGFHAEQIHLF
jgi:hypothetical protein